MIVSALSAAELDLGVLKDLSSKKIMLGVLDLGNPEVDTAGVVASRIRRPAA